MDILITKPHPDCRHFEASQPSRHPFQDGAEYTRKKVAKKRMAKALHESMESIRKSLMGEDRLV